MKYQALIIRIILWASVILVLAVFFSYRLLQTPLGLTADEGAFGLNAVLLSQTLHDETGRFLPVFVLSLDRTDWRQPVAQYYYTAFFKLFGASVFNLRFSSVVITLVSFLLLYYLVDRLTNNRLITIASSVVLLTTPIIMIQSHLGLDNIIPVPLTLLWLLTVFLSQTRKSKFYLLLSGISLGLAFYSYKGMRATVPVWYLLTLWYLLYRTLVISPTKSLLAVVKKTLPSLTWFTLGLLPFIVIIPILNIKYPGAVTDKHTFAFTGVYDFIEPYLSSFDPSYLFVSGDSTPWHSTGRHGMLLLASLPLFIPGLVLAYKKKQFWWLIILAFFTAPLLYGTVGSIHRASRLLCMVPMYAAISGLGFSWWLQKKKILSTLIVLFAIYNYTDFVHYYWYKYPEVTRQWFGELSSYQDFVIFGQAAKKLGLTPVFDDQISNDKNHSGRFFTASYVGWPAKYLSNNQPLPAGSLFMSVRQDIPGLVPVDISLPHFYLLKNP